MMTSEHMAYFLAEGQELIFFISVTSLTLFIQCTRSEANFEAQSSDDVESRRVGVALAVAR